MNLICHRLTLAVPGIELYPDPGRWELDPESAWNEADIELAKEFLNKLTATQELSNAQRDNS